MYLEREGSQVMLCQRNGNWETGDLQSPLGRGINFQMFVHSVEPLLDALRVPTGRCSGPVMTRGIELRERSAATDNFWCRIPMAICCGSRRIWGRGNIAELASIRIPLPAQESAP